MRNSERNRITTLISFLGLFILAPLSSAAANDEIVYGGVGNLGRDAQPCLARMYESEHDGFRPFTDDINSHIRDVLARTDVTPGNEGIIVTADQLYDAVAADGFEFDERPSQDDIKEFLEDNEEHLYVLAIVGTFEAYYQLPIASSEATFREFYIVGVSAILVQIAGDIPGQIVLAGTALTEGQLTRTEDFPGNASAFCSADNAMWPDSLGNLVAVYKDAAERAIANLSAKREKADEGVDSIIVTGAQIGSEKISDLFGVVPTSSTSVCNQPNPCPDGASDCQDLVGLLAFGTTDAFSARGYLAVPPLNWSSWGKTAQYQATKNVRLTGGRREINEVITVNVGPDSADMKLVPSISKYAAVGKPAGTGGTFKDLFMAWLEVPWYETEYGKCETVNDSGLFVPKKNSYKPVSLVRALRASDDPALPVGIQRAYSLAAVMAALGGLRKSLDEAE